MIEIEEKKLGTSKNLSSLLIFSSCFDNIFALIGHGVMLGVLFDSNSIQFMHLNQHFN